MAKKQQQQNTPLQNTSNVDTDLFNKGMHKDPNPSFQGRDGFYSHARNAINNSKEGDVNVLGNEPANYLCAEIPYTIIGFIHLTGDNWIVFSTDNSNSVIGRFDDSKCHYEQIVNDPCLSFNTSHLVTGASKEMFDCSWQVYWDDGLNPSRTLNLDDIPYVQIQTTGPLIDGTPCVTYIDAQPLQLDCERLRLHPLMQTPCVTLTKSDTGGLLGNGTYQAFICYTMNGEKIGDYLGVSNVQSLWDHADTTGALDITITNLDTQFDFFKLVIMSNIKGNIVAKEIGEYSTQQSFISISVISHELISIPTSDIIRRSITFERSDNMYVVNDYLIRSGPTTNFDFNYQPLANQIQTHWVSTAYPADYYNNGGNKTSFMRDEQYAFFIRFIYNTGEKSHSYHIPGRPNGGYAINPINDNTLTGFDAVNDINTDNVAWRIRNTAVDASGTLGGIGVILPDGGRVIGKGYMGYWESTELYPSTDPAGRWNSNTGDPNYNLCGTPIRHHKMPDEQTSTACHLNGQSGTNLEINLLGVEFVNIQAPVDNDGNFIQNIVGYEILVGSRQGNKSIIAKGLMRNMRRYTLPQADDSRSAAGSVVTAGSAFAEGAPIIHSGVNSGLMPNYPFNDCDRNDPFLRDTQGSGNLYQGGLMTPSIFSADWSGGDTYPLGFTFHSPDTMFKKIYLNPSEVYSYGMRQGQSIGKFKKSERHPGHKLLRDISAFVAALIGTGYAIEQSRGKKTKKVTGAKAMSIGKSGGPWSDNTSGGTFTTNPYTITGGGYTISVAPPALVPTGPITVGSGGGVTTNDNTTDSEVPTANVNPVTGQPYSTGDAPSQDGTVIGVAGTQGIAEQNLAAYENTAGVPNTSGTVNITSVPPLTTDPLFADLVSAPIATTGPGMQNTVDTSENSYALNHGLQSISTTSISTPNQQELRYFRSVRQMHVDALRNTSSYIGPGEEITHEGSRYKSLPGLGQILLKMYQTMNMIALGGQEIIDLIYNLASYQDYAWKYNAHGFYNNVLSPYNNNSQIHRQNVQKARYLSNTIQNITSGIRVNNLHRPKTVAVLTNPITLPVEATVFSIPTSNQDNSRVNLGALTGNPTAYFVRDICAHYVGLKVDFRNQYGQLDGIKQIPAENCTQLFLDNNPMGTTPDVNSVFTSDIIFGGEMYINRYTEKVIMPFFYDYLAEDQPDGTPFDYRLRQNIPSPEYWAFFANYDLSGLVSPVTDLSFNWTGVGGTVPGLPSQFHNLDFPGDDMSTFGGILSALVGNGRGLFVLKEGAVYLHNSGINDFFVESEINVAQRDWKENRGERHYDWLEYTDFDELFHVDSIKDGNFYMYDESLTKAKLSTQLVSWGTIQDLIYDPLIAETCYDYYPKRLIYSLQAQKESKEDFWRIFLPFNYKDFKNPAVVMKPISKNGAMVFYPNLSPTVFQGVDQLTTDMESKITIGDGGLFSQPFQNVVNSDLPHEYGSCESARSVINTPSGLFYISQEQGKIFHYAGQLINIADAGLKHWFNEYLPSRLLNAFPEIENYPEFYDNPVTGIGCQSVYDPKYDLVYFCKKDYEPVPDPDSCIQFDTESGGFIINETECYDVAQNVICPTGYTLEDGICVLTTECAPDSWDRTMPGEFIETVTRWVPADRCEMDVVFVIDASSSVITNCNTDRAKLMLDTFINGMQAGMDAGDIQVGMITFNFAANTLPQIGNMDTTNCPDCLSDVLSWNWATAPVQQPDCYGAETMSDYADAKVQCCFTWPLQQTTSVDNVQSFIDNYYCSMGEGDIWNDPAPCNICANLKCTNVIDATWHGMEMLYDPNFARQGVPKKLIVIKDGFHNINPFYPMNTFMTAEGWANSAYGNLSGGYNEPLWTNHINNTGSTASPPTPDYTWDNGTGGNVNYPDYLIEPGTYAISTTPFAATDQWTAWLNTNIIQNAQYLDPTVGVLEMINLMLYNGVYNATADQYNANTNTNPGLALGNYYSDFTSSTAINDMVENVLQNLCMEAVTEDIYGDPYTITEYACPEDSVQIGETQEGIPICECTLTAAPQYEDVITPISLTNEEYFTDISWTASYDPKGKAWISFHDWHPELTVSSLNHFLTTKTGTTEEVFCPPGTVLNEYGQCEYLACPTGYISLDDSSSLTCCAEFVEPPDVDTIEGSRDEITALSVINPTFLMSMEDWNNIATDNPSYPAVPNCYSSGAQLQANGPPGMHIHTPLPWTRCPFITDASDLNGTGVGTFQLSADPTTGMLALSPDTLPTNLYNIYPPFNGPCNPSDPNGWSWMNGVNFPGSSGPTMLGLVHEIQSDMNWQEGTSQQMSGAMIPNQPYQGTIDLRNTPPGGPFNSIGRLLIFGGFSQCCYDELLWASPFISDQSWTTYTINFTPLAAYDHIHFKIESQYFNAQSGGANYSLYQGDPNYEFITTNHINFGNITPDPGRNISQAYLLVDNFTGVDLTVEIPDVTTCNCPDINGMPSTMVLNDGLFQTPADPQQCIDAWEEDGTYAVMCVVTECVDPITITTEPSNQVGGIWRHNDRCDLFANYYAKQYPWEVELVESVGQTIDVLRSVEYQLESYVYIQNTDLDTGEILNLSCEDRWHDLEYNFNEAIIYNTEQISGLLKMELTPAEMNNVPLITEYPIVNAADIEILYSKVEQKYRFNQFWDITADRTAIVSQFITQLNGYIKELNEDNLNYNKPQLQRKRFRHYWNRVILRRQPVVSYYDDEGEPVYVPEDRKMLLKIVNTKLNQSVR